MIVLIEPKKEPSGFLEKYNLNKWNIALPVAILTLLPAIEAEVCNSIRIILFTYLLLSFCSICWLMLI